MNFTGIRGSASAPTRATLRGDSIRAEGDRSKFGRSTHESTLGGDDSFAISAPPRHHPPPSTNIRPVRATWHAIASTQRSDINARLLVDRHLAALTESAIDGDGISVQNSGASRIVLIDPRALFRDCLAYCLSEAYADRQIASYASIAEWMACSEGDQPPAVVLLSVPGTRKLANGNSAEIALPNQVGDNIPIIIISDSEDSARILHALKSGARGYIPTTLALAVAVEAVRLVDAGGTFVPVSTLLASRLATADNGNTLFTPRQIMVIEALHRGKTNKQIALELNMRESTVKVHIRHIMKKLKARNRTEVAVLTNGLFAPPDMTDFDDSAPRSGTDPPGKRVSTQPDPGER
ncbi:MAG: response regulator transcription factor [Xanthobacteraceae bacterium]|nr:response regulator transcription factor [Xanthobacteraceae bacterium]